MSETPAKSQSTTRELQAKRTEIASRYQLAYEEFTFHQQAVNAATRQMRAAERKMAQIAAELVELTQEKLAL